MYFIFLVEEVLSSFCLKMSGTKAIENLDYKRPLNHRHPKALYI